MTWGGGYFFEENFSARVLEQKKNVGPHSQEKNILAQTPVDTLQHACTKKNFGPSEAEKKYFGFENAKKNFSGSVKNPPPDHLVLMVDP